MDPIIFAFNQSEIENLIGVSKSKITYGLFNKAEDNETYAYAFADDGLGDPSTTIGCPYPPGWGPQRKLPTIAELTQGPKFEILLDELKKVIDQNEFNPDNDPQLLVHFAGVIAGGELETRFTFRPATERGFFKS